jgi:uncharacterized membrane protein
MVLIISSTYNYIYLFNQLLVFQNISIDKKAFSVFNFIILQIQELLNINLFYQFYLFLTVQQHRLYKYLISFKFVAMMTALFMKAILAILNQLSLIAFLVVFFGTLVKKIKRVMREDNQQALGILEKDIESNGYMEMKIAGDEVYDLVA